MCRHVYLLLKVWLQRTAAHTISKFTLNSLFGVIWANLIAAVMASSSVMAGVDDIVFPAQESLVVSSTFGPRRLSGRFDFHRGIDIRGELESDIYAMADGVVVSINTGSGSILIEHPHLSSARGGPVYSRYTHLASIDVEAPDEVVAGQVIGGMGNTNANNVHLHFEIREDTPFSLTYQLDNGGCRTNPCKDPHVHPFNYLGMHDLTAPDVEVISQQGEPLRIRATVSSTELDINRFEIRSPGHETIILDYNTRRGFNATSTENIDRNPLESGPEFEVFSFNLASVERGDDFVVEIEFPGIFEYTSIRVFDTYGNVAELSNDDDFLLRLIPSIVRMRN